jgi:predicted Zn-dependent peptidase
LHTLTTLDNGLRLITCKMPHTRSVSIVLFIGAGVCYETDDEVGVSHFIEHLCFKGTKRRPSSKAISEAIEGVGGILNGATDKELTVVWCKVASQYLSHALDVLFDIVRNSRFHIRDIDKERQVIIEEINMSLDSPQQRVDMMIDELLWDGQPLGRDCAGRKESILYLAKPQINKYFQKHYLPNNCVVSIAGNVEQKEVTDLVRKCSADWQPYKLPQRFSTDMKQKHPKMRVEIRDTEQVNLCIGVLGPSLLHPDRFALDLLSVVLGEGMSSRLFIEIRENQGLAYDIGTCTTHFIDSGAFYVSAGVDPKRLNDALISISDQLSKIKDGVTKEELRRARELAKGRLLLALEDSRIVANWFGAQEILLDRILPVDEVISLIDNITSKDLERVAHQVIINRKLNLAVVGPVGDEKELSNILKM